MVGENVVESGERWEQAGRVEMVVNEIGEDDDGAPVVRVPKTIWMVTGSRKGPEGGY